MAVDPLTLTVVWNRLVNVAEEMGNTLRKTAYSPGIRDAEDCAFALFDAETRMIAEAVYTPGQSSSMPFALRNALKAHPASTLEPGDGLVLNDPYLGNGHLPDVYVFMPVFVGGQIVGYAGCCGHHTDVGGAAPGSQAVQGIYDLYQEGMIIPPVVFYKKRQPVHDVLELIAGNTRLRQYTLGDLQGQYSACTIGERGVIRLYEDVGPEVWTACIEEMLRRTEAEMREAIEALPDGDYAYEGYVDDFEEGSPPIRIAATITVKGPHLEVDYTGTDGQVPAAINSPLNLTYSYTLYALKGALAPSLPANEGIRRPISISAPEGSILNPQFPAPCAARAILVPRIIDTVMGALSTPLPTRAIAAASQFVNTLAGGRNPRTGRPFVSFQIMTGGFPARPDCDGEEGLPLGYNTGNVPIEIDEATDPVMVERFELVRDSAGAGKFRGGLGFRKDVRLLSGPLRVSNNTDRHKFPAWGLHGGGDGAIGVILLNPGPNERCLHSKGVYTLEQGDLISIRIGGAGGWGDPYTRDPQAVVDDVLDDLITVDRACSDYGVKIVDGRVDVEATQKLRTHRQLP
jgi:N-methylhydantoinase B